MNNQYETIAKITTAVAKQCNLTYIEVHNEVITFIRDNGRVPTENELIKIIQERNIDNVAFYITKNLEEYINPYKIIEDTQKEENERELKFWLGKLCKDKKGTQC